MIRVNCNIPLGVPNLGTPFKCFDPLSALAGAAANVVGGLFGSHVQKNNSKQLMRQQHRYNMAEMQHSMSLQRGQMDYLANTMYGKQVSGMKNAGLNPAMDGGSQAASLPNAGVPSTGSSGASAPLPNIDLLGGAQQGALLEAQIDNIKADTNQKNADADNKDADTRLKEIQASPAFVKANLDKLSADAQRAWAACALDNQKVIQSMEEVKKIGKEMNLADAQIDKLVQETGNLRKEYEVLEAEVGLKKAQTYLQYSSARLNKALEANAYASAAEARERINSNLYGSQAALNNSLANQADSNADLLKKKGFTEDEIAKCRKFESKLLEFDVKVNENYGALDKAGLQFAKDLIGVVVPNVSLSSSSSFVRHRK